MTNANDLFRDFSGSFNYHKYLHGNLLTDGALHAAETLSCFWFLDIICSHQPMIREHDFQVWTLQKREDESALIQCTNGNDVVLAQQLVEWTDFPHQTFTLWKEGDVILLPSEH